jgi:hypothetical protein
MSDTNASTPVDTFGYDWIASLLDKMDGSPAQVELIKSCHAVHYRAANLEEILAGYRGDLEGFIRFLEGTWGWKVSYDRAAGTLLADEAKSYCVCPVAQKSSQPVSGLLCHCSEGIAEHMFSLVVGHPVKASVVRSILRGAPTCIYSIQLEG